jgi:hypothetical protein
MKYLDKLGKIIALGLVLVCISSITIIMMGNTVIKIMTSTPTSTSDYPTIPASLLSPFMQKDLLP